MTSAQSITRQPWQSPFVVVACGCLVAMLTFGPRTTLGLILPSMSRDTGWTRDVFALGIAIQHLVWGLGQPFAGAIADRMGTLRALGTGALVYSLGLAVMANATAPAVLYAAGALVGLGLAGASFNIVLAAFGKLLTERWRPLATGFGGAAGSFGQFLFSPFCILLLENGWRTPLLVFGAMLLLVVPLSVPLATTAHGREEAMGAAPFASCDRCSEMRCAVLPTFCFLRAISSLACTWLSSICICQRICRTEALTGPRRDG
jgi:MFS family permease